MKVFYNIFYLKYRLDLEELKNYFTTDGDQLENISNKKEKSPSKKYKIFLILIIENS